MGKCLIRGGARWTKKNDDNLDIAIHAAVEMDLPVCYADEEDAVKMGRVFDHIYVLLGRLAAARQVVPKHRVYSDGLSTVLTDASKEVIGALKAQFNLTSPLKPNPKIAG